jgi:hypothetical protein
MILFVPFKKIASYMGKSRYETKYFLTETEQRRARKLGKMISYVSDCTPWESKCFVQALTGFMLLRLFHIPSTIYFGVRKQPDDSLVAHAWLRAGDQVITGDEERIFFIPVAKYGQYAKAYN